MADDKPDTGAGMVGRGDGRWAPDSWVLCLAFLALLVQLALFVQFALLVAAAADR